MTPSVVSVDTDGTVYVGETAKERGVLHPLDTARVFKRSMGTDKQYEELFVYIDVMDALSPFQHIDWIRELTTDLHSILMKKVNFCLTSI